MNNFTLHVKWTNEIHVYKYKTQNLDVQCKKKKAKIYFDAIQKFKKHTG